MKNFTLSLVGIFFFALLGFLGCKKDSSLNQARGITADARLAGKKATMSTPTLACNSSTQVSITLNVCAGETGAPAGFSIQWMTKADNDANGWPTDSEDPATQSTFCKASFSGNANSSRYNLGPNACVLVNIGEFLFDNGASTGCPGALTCGTEYVFRVFAHANSTTFKSGFSGNQYCSTLPCQCTFTQGYWKTHGPVPLGNNSNEWEVTSLTLGTVSYTDLELLSIFNTGPAGNGLISLAHQLIAAKLNIANGSGALSIQSSIDAADALIGGLVIPPAGSGYLEPSATSDLTTALANYNEGITGPGHCD